MTSIQALQKAIREKQAEAWQKRARTAKHLITWQQLDEWAFIANVSRSHAARVFRGARKSEGLEASFADHFGFPMESAAFDRRSGDRWVKAP